MSPRRKYPSVLFNDDGRMTSPEKSCGYELELEIAHVMVPFIPCPSVWVWVSVSVQYFPLYIVLQAVT